MQRHSESVTFHSAGRGRKTASFFEPQEGVFRGTEKAPRCSGRAGAFTGWGAARLSGRLPGATAIARFYFWRFRDFMNLAPKAQMSVAPRPMSSIEKPAFSTCWAVAPTLEKPTEPFIL